MCLTKSNQPVQGVLPREELMEMVVTPVVPIVKNGDWHMENTIVIMVIALHLVRIHLAIKRNRLRIQRQIVIPRASQRSLSQKR